MMMMMIVLHPYTKFEVRSLPGPKKWLIFGHCFNLPGDLDLWVWPFDLETGSWLTRITSQLSCQFSVSCVLPISTKGEARDRLDKQAHRRRSRGAEGAVAPTCRKGGKRYQMPPFRRLSGMMPASTKKRRHI